MVVVAISITILLQTLVSIWLSRIGIFHVPSVGTIHVLDVEVYGGDLKYINGQPCLDWGIVYPGTLVNRSFYVKSKSNVDGILKIRVTNWIFNNSKVHGPYDKKEGISVLNPVLNDTILRPNDIVRLTLTLNVSSSSKLIEFVLENNIKSFSFDVFIFLSETA